jgi:putative transposase
VSFEAIAAERAHYPVQVLSPTLGVSPSGFYASRMRPESTRAQDVRRLKVLLHALVAGGRGYYGSPRIHDDFIEWGEHVSRKRIIRIKQEDGLIARVVKR